MEYLAIYNAFALPTAFGWNILPDASPAEAVFLCPQTESDPIPLASESIQAGSVRALRSLMGVTARRS